MRVKNKKSEFKPIRITGKNKYVVSWDYRPLYKDGKETTIGTWEEYIFSHYPDINEIKEVILGYYNSAVDAEILSGHTWNGYPIWLSNENQFNYKAAYDIAVQTNGGNFPLKFKFGTNDNPQYHTFTSVVELADFYMSSISHIQKTLNEGWDVKDNIDWTLYEK